MVSKNILRRVARNIVRTNFDIKQKDVVVISCGPKSLDFAESLAYECAIIGAQPMITYGSDSLSLKIYNKINPKFLKFKPKMGWAHLKVVDADMFIDESDPFIARKLPQKKIEIRRKAVKPLRNAREKRLMSKETKSALIGFPTEEEARHLGLPFKRLESMFWSAMDVDFQKMFEFNARLMRKLGNADKIRIVGDRTDLTFSVKGRKFLNDAGIVEKEDNGYMNLPAGEIFVAPVENSANGEVYFDLQSMWHYGKTAKGVWFKFSRGKVVKYRIDKGVKDFEDVLKNASGTKTTIAELGIGTNPNAKITGGMIIVDEKVKGTIHIAIGDNILFGGKSRATMHWDFFKTMGRGSALYADGKPLMKDGKFI